MSQIQPDKRLHWGEGEHKRIQDTIERLREDEVERLEDEANGGKPWRKVVGQMTNPNEEACLTRWMLHKWKTFDNLFDNGGINWEKFERQGNLSRRTGEDFSSLTSTRRWVEEDDGALNEENVIEQELSETANGSYIFLPFHLLSSED